MAIARSTYTRPAVLTDTEKAMLMTALLFGSIGLLISLLTIVLDQQIAGDWY